MNAFPLQLSPRLMAPRWLLGGVVVALTVVLCIWLLVASGVQRSDAGSALPEPLPEAPSTIQTEHLGTGVEVAPAPVPGPDIAPVNGGLSPR